MTPIKSVLRQTLGKPVHLPASQWKHFAESDLSAPYVASCLGKYAILYVSPNFEKLTGYACKRFRSEGVAFWFSVIHPADMQAVVGSITRAQHELVTTNPRPTAPLKLEYRITRRDGSLIWIREFKLIVSWREEKKDHILGCLHDITAEKLAEQNTVRALLQQDKASHGLLEAAVSHQLVEASEQGKVVPPSSGRVSAREKQVLRLVAAGHSSKQIAAELDISENTVETHRRHLLGKFKVNSSAALVKEAHRRCVV
jgi:PAS domain S-box-containing protein